MKKCRIEGYTWTVKDQLKALGARWDGDTKAWYITEDKLEEANAIVAAAPKEEKKPKKPIHARCPSCGTEFTV